MANFLILGVLYAVCRPFAALNAIPDQKHCGAIYEALKMQMNWYQATMADIIQIAKRGNVTELEPYVDLVTWIHTGEENFIREQLDQIPRVLSKEGQIVYYSRWNRARVANLKWVALHTIDAYYRQLAEEELLGFYNFYGFVLNNRDHFEPDNVKAFIAGHSMW